MSGICSGRNIISYHYPCPDGIFAALAASLHFSQRNISNVQWVPNRVFAPCTIQELGLKKEDTLYMLDYVGPPNFARDAAKLAGRVVLLDHHKTAMEAYQDKTDLPPNLDVCLQMQLSGATIALKHFNPKVSPALEQLFAFIEDADLWRWDLKDSKFFHTGLGSSGLEYDVHKNPNIFKELLELRACDVIAKGREVQEQQDIVIRKAVKAASKLQIRKSDENFGECLAYHVPAGSNLGSLRSQLGNALADEARTKGLQAMGMVAYMEAEMRDPDMIKCSLRSIGDVDTSAISKQFGGGGHKNASSFIVPLKEFHSWSQDFSSC